MPRVIFPISPSLYLRDPQRSELGRRILSESVELMNMLGFEHFTFKKLADHIGSTEASVYRYFENKHRLLLYLIDWYWLMVGYQFDIATQNLTDPRDRLNACLRVFLSESWNHPYDSEINLVSLKRLVTGEFEKTYLTKQVDNDNKEGLFQPYKAVCRKLAELVKEINPRFPFPRTLINTILLSANHQLFYAEHLPSLTEIKFNPDTHYQYLEKFLHLILFKTIDS
jgi:AcrR family transcriptional regulator